MSRLIVVFVTILVLHTKRITGEGSGDWDIKNLLQIGGDVQITEISQTRTSRNLDNTYEYDLENFFKSNEISMRLPFSSSLNFNGRALDKDEYDFKLKLNSGSDVQARKKSRIKRIIAPILVVLLLKAITLIPLALGLIGLKTWNALQLAFVSFVTSVVLAVWKLCTKFSDHHSAPHIIHEAVHDVHIPHVYHDSHHDHHDHHVVHHGHYQDDPQHDPWNRHYHRSDGSAQHIAYNEYAPEIKM